MSPSSCPQKRILVVVTAGGFTHAAPLLELASVLAARGYMIDFATFVGREKWVENCSFIHKIHVVGSPAPQHEEEAAYRELSDWPSDIMSNWKPIFNVKKFLESSWPEVYRHLGCLVADQATRPDFILADNWVQAAQDVSYEEDIPLAMLWPQMPTGMLPAPYIPGTPGLQIEVLTSENATLWQRLKNACAIYTSLPYYLRYVKSTKAMRASEGVHRPLPRLSKPNYLCLVNSFFGLEAAKDLPPNVAAVGPILADQVASMPTTFEGFLKERKNVLYIALGTRVLLGHRTLYELVSGAVAALRSGTIDGIIWSIPKLARNQLDFSSTIAIPPTSTIGTQGGKNSTMTLGELLENKHPSVFVADFAPQRALLQDKRVVAFVSHAGSSSANEAVFAGVPLITLPVYNDQIQTAMRLRDAGVSIPMQKETVTARKISLAVERIVNECETGGPIKVNVVRLCRVAQIAARRKHHGADLIEEVLADYEGRRAQRQVVSKRSRPMHLQTADMRMPMWKARNLDLLAVAVAALATFIGVVTLPFLGTDVINFDRRMRGLA